MSDTLALRDKLTVTVDGESYDGEVFTIVDTHDSAFAVSYFEDINRILVTDLYANPVEDEQISQPILQDVLALSAAYVQ